MYQKWKHCDFYCGMKGGENKRSERGEVENSKSKEKEHVRASDGEDDSRRQSGKYKRKELK